MKKPYFCEHNRWIIVHKPSSVIAKNLLFELAKLKLYREIYYSIRNVLCTHHI